MLKVLGIVYIIAILHLQQANSNPLVTSDTTMTNQRIFQPSLLSGSRSGRSFGFPPPFYLHEYGGLHHNCQDGQLGLFRTRCTPTGHHRRQIRSYPPQLNYFNRKFRKNKKFI